MDWAQRVRETIDLLNPRLTELAEGYVEFIEADEEEKTIKVMLIEGRLH